MIELVLVVSPAARRRQFEDADAVEFPVPGSPSMRWREMETALQQMIETRDAGPCAVHRAPGS
jgi:hypothetical protein